MRRSFVIFFLALTIIVTILINLSFAEQITEIDGFRGIKWGVSEKEIPGLMKLETPIKGGENIAFYTKKIDILKIGNYDISNIIYGFWKNKLISIRLIPKKSSDIVNLRSFLIEGYGNPITLPPPTPPNVFWWRHGNTSIWLNVNDGIIIIGDQEVLIQKARDEKADSISVKEEGSDKLNEPDGFRGIKWGTSIYKLNDMKFIRNDQSYGGMKVYLRQGDKLEIGSSNLQAIEYFFWKDRFCSVMIKTSGEPNFSSLKESVFLKYGPGSKPNEFSESYIWPKRKVTGIMLKLEPITEKGLLMLTSVTIENEQGQFEKVKNKEGAEKGF